MHTDIFFPVDIHYFLDFSHDIYTHGLECWQFSRKFWYCNISVQKASLGPIASSRDSTPLPCVPWDPGMPQIGYRCAEIFIPLAFGAAPSYGAAKGSSIHPSVLYRHGYFLCVPWQGKGREALALDIRSKVCTTFNAVSILSMLFFSSPTSGTSPHT